MEATVLWVNQKTANFLRDHKQQPEPEDYPNRTCRGTCRFLFLLVLSTTFALSVTDIINTGSPNVQVTVITDLQTKNREFIPRYVYNTSDLTLPERLKIVSCVCNTTTISWKEFTKFYILNENSTEWHIQYNETSLDITLPMDPSGNYTQYDLPTTTVRTMQEPATSDTFCPTTSLWPSDGNTSFCTNGGICTELCSAISGRLLTLNKTEKFKLDPEKIFKLDPEKINKLDPEILLESPILLTPEVLRALVVKHARDLLLSTRERMSLLVADPTATLYDDALTLFLLNALNPNDVQDYESYYLGATNQQANFYFRFISGDRNPKVLVLNNSEGIAFLHMDINWTRYAEICIPQYCRVTEQMNLPRKVYWAFALVGGSTTAMLAVVNIVLWPAIAFLLSQWGRKTSPPKTPNASENEGDGLLPSGARSDESEMVSMSIAPGPLPPLAKTKSTRPIHPQKMLSRGREAQGPEDK